MHYVGQALLFGIEMFYPHGLCPLTFEITLDEYIIMQHCVSLNNLSLSEVIVFGRLSHSRTKNWAILQQRLEIMSKYF